MLSSRPKVSHDRIRRHFTLVCADARIVQMRSGRDLEQHVAETNAAWQRLLAARHKAGLC